MVSCSPWATEAIAGFGICSFDIRAKSRNGGSTTTESEGRSVRAYSSIVLVILLAVGLTSCVGLLPKQIDANDQAAIQAAVQVTHDDFKKATTFKGPNTKAFGTSYLRAFKLDTGGLMKYRSI